MTTHISGLSGSGLDVDQLVKDAMKAQRSRYDTLVQKKTQLEWKKADYNTMYKEINDFRSNTAFNYKMQKTLVPKTASSSDTDVVAVTANADAANVGHTLTVTKLAAGVNLTSSDKITTGSGKDTIADQLGISGTFKLTITNGTASKEISVDSSQSIYELVSNINNAGVNVKANYDANLDRFFMYTTNSGAASEITLDDNDSGLVNALNIPTTQKGQDAAFSLDGTSLTQSSNNFTISGVTYALKGQGTSNVSVSSDIDKTVDNVKAFVEAYNKTLDTINAKVDETYYKDYLPLTTDQKTSMKDTEITAWEAKAKSGLLRRDTILQGTVDQMRSDISSPISGLTGKYTNASSIGITTGNYTEGGHLYLDENKLKAALQDDPDIVYKMFGTDGSTHSSDGIATRLYDTLKESSDKVVTVAGITATTDYDTQSNLAKQITDYTDRMSDMTDRLNDMEDRYYKQFDAMETALSKLNQQSSWLSQQLGTSSS